jgi:hypothetical protein
METGPVGKVKLTESFRGQAATLERLRAHRQLDEALAQGPDPPHLASVFGLDPKRRGPARPHTGQLRWALADTNTPRAARHYL